MKREAVSHTKMKRLCRRLDIPQWQGVGILESIWHLAAREAPRGDIGKLSDEDIALGIDYRGDESKLIEGLVASGWLDRDPKERLVIHQWYEHADDAINMKLARARQFFVGGYAPKISKLPSREREAAAEFYSSCARNAEPCARNTESDTLSEHDVRTPGVPPEPEPRQSQIPEPRQIPEPVAAPGRVLPIRPKIDGISPDAWEEFQERYAQSGKPLNESDWVKAAMEAASLRLSDSDLRERVLPALLAELPAWADRDVAMIPYPANWFKGQPWTRTAKQREPTLTREQRKQREIDREWESIANGSH